MDRNESNFTSYLKECIVNMLETTGRNKCPIPLILYTKSGNMLDVYVKQDTDYYFNTPFFIIKKIDKTNDCVLLSSLEPVGIDGCTVDFPIGCVYSLIETNKCLTVNLSCFCGIQTLSSKLVNRDIPIIQPK